MPNYFHSKCVNMSESEFEKRSKKYEFFCPGKCEMSIMPFNCFSSSDTFIKYCDPLSDFFPCIICKTNCTDDCIQCDFCDGWVHNDCSDLGSELSLFIDNDREFFCGTQKCTMKLLPLYGGTKSFDPDYSLLCAVGNDDNNSVELQNLASTSNNVSYIYPKRLSMLKKKAADSSNSV